MGNQYLVLGLCFVTFSTFALLVLNIMSRNSSVTKRLTEVRTRSTIEDLKNELHSLGKEDRRKVNPILRNLIDTVYDSIQVRKQSKSRMRKLLSYAGFRTDLSLRLFITIKIVSMFVLSGVMLGVAFLQHAMASGLLYAGFGALLGFILPDFILKTLIRTRQDAIAASLPDALDFLVICVEAGLGLNSALVRVGMDMRIRARELSDEFLLVNRELRTGANREQAFRNLGERNRVRHLNSMVNAIILSDRLGTNIADTLRAQSDFLRTHIRQIAEEKAAKSAIHILFPLVLFILPALMITILGPAILMFRKQVVPIMQP
jgi:tight adherence protein C